MFSDLLCGYHIFLLIFYKMSYNVYKFVKKYFPEVFEYYKLEKYGLDNLGKIIMQLDDNPENESNILEKIKNDKCLDFKITTSREW